ncbi:hypothetical protein ZIOFF_071790 [Zingiber officinale]|uniref:C2 domain-containing protein n=2 Tax=Zingiber officinale TaxID=94328 RepID=A0A8J5C490_ZINOF|nr:hypothetical protein ZIOFF_071790 [Zingiber officinale]
MESPRNRGGAHLRRKSTDVDSVVVLQCCAFNFHSIPVNLELWRAKETEFNFTFEESLLFGLFNLVRLVMVFLDLFALLSPLRPGFAPRILILAIFILQEPFLSGICAFLLRSSCSPHLDFGEKFVFCKFVSFPRFQKLEFCRLSSQISGVHQNICAYLDRLPFSLLCNPILLLVQLLAEAMESYQAVPATFGSAAAAAAANGAGPKPIAGPVLESTNSFSDEFNPEDFIGFLEVFVHQARDIHNICIYHKQDVFAKLCLTNNPDVTVSTQTINGGGRNPVFNQNLRLNVKNINCSMKCEIWMLSKAKNYLEDQLLGFALVPLSDVLMANGKLVKEYSLSSTDLFHSPAGFVQLSISYVGASPEVMTIPSLPKSLIVDTTLPDAEPDNSIPCDYEKIEFPDLKADKENQLMVSEYYGIPCTDMETQSSDSFVTAENDNCAGEEAGMRIVESFSTANSHDSIGNLKRDTAASSFSTTESTVVLPASSDPLSSTASPRPNVKSLESMEAEVDSSRAASDDAFFKPIIKIDVPEQPVVQQDFVDMYMKSMQQFTESLAKLKLPMDIDNSSTASENGNSGPTQENGSSGSEKTMPTPKSNGSRVFYGSRAFF